jgi:predicted ribosome quality control (RQC) complex YloA/Tae2 family protein
VHNSYFFLVHLSATLAEKLQGFVLVSCFSQNKDEMVLEFNNSKSSFFIKASLQPSFCCLSFPQVFHRAKKNSVDLFSEALMKKVVSVTQFENERSFLIQLEARVSLLFKMHGSQSNIILLQEGKVMSIFKNQFQTDWEIDCQKLNRTIDWSRAGFLQSQQHLKTNYFTLSREFWDYLTELDFEKKSENERWNTFHSTIEKLRNPHFYIGKEKDKLVFSLLPLHNPIKEYSDPIEALNYFFHLATAETALSLEKKSALRHLHDQLRSKQNFISRNEIKLNELLNDHHYQLWGDLIMANMHQIKIGTEQVTLPSFYNQQPIAIKLKKEFNAQRNAEIFYRKSKNQQIEINKLKESIAQKKKEMLEIEKKILSVETSNDIKLLRKSNENVRIKNEPPLPYREIEFKGFKIWLGKSAEANDELTLKHSYKEDLWLHAKDVAGSHVLIKHQANKPFPKDVIERAAQLAAFYSKRKNDSLCPVTVTAKKFVRKRKGDAVGAVIVEKEDVILVQPID